jgi:hypothetical protein
LLLSPLYRKPLQQILELQPRRLTPAQNRLDYIGRQQGQPQDATDVGLVDFLGTGDLRDGAN